MYLNFFKLTKEPFNITPDPELLFLSPSHREALAAAIYGVKQRKGFIAIIGEVGVGKTTILRSFLERANDKLKTIYLFNANLSFPALLRTIYEGLGRRWEQAEPYEMVDRLHRILIEEYQAGNNVVLVVDEAQNMPTETLENLRMLSNLETATDKLLQVVFSGQPEFEQRLAEPGLRQFRQRIVVSVRIQPLTSEESCAYIEHRIAKTAAGSRALFSAGALRKIVGKAGGIPRVINILCDNCLLSAFGRQQLQVSAQVAKETIAEYDGAPPAAGNWKTALPAGLLVAAVLVVVPGAWRSSLEKSVQPAQLAKTATGAGRLPAAQEAAAMVAPPRGADAAAGGERPGAGHGGRQKVEAAAPPPLPLPLRERGAGATGGAAHRVIRRGDTLAALIVRHYGRVDRRLIEEVKRRNPQIVNENVIVEGSSIYFPAHD